MKPKTIFLLSSTAILASLSVYQAYRYKRNKNGQKELDAAKQSGSNESKKGEAKIIQGDAWDENYWKVNNTTTLPNYARSVEISKNLNKWIGKYYSDEKLIKELFATFPNKMYVSKIADTYKSLYKKKLIDDLKTIDKFQIAGEDFPDIQKLVDAMPYA